MSLEQEFKNCNLKDMQLLYSTTKTVVLDNFLNPKQRINNCNHKSSQTFKGANGYDNKNYFNEEKENLFNT